MNINSQNIKSLSSRKMVNLETQKSIIILGEQIVKELKLDFRGDTISRWMANYIAEQIIIAKKSTGLKKRNAENKCFEIILKLWESRSYFPNGKKPFEKFEIIAEILEKISPDNTTPYYYEEYRSSKSTKNKKLKDLLNIAKVIDEAARVWLEQVFVKAIKDSSSKKIKKYLKNALHFNPNNDVNIIVKLLDDIDNNEKSKTIQKEIESLKIRLKQIDDFIVYSKELKNYYMTELREIERKKIKK